ncbi:MAG: hypothetical protein Q8T13_20900 [Acidobacteriota bacterium]|nr:hypothetical protein [Acidobacteriota bacterium]
MHVFGQGLIAIAQDAGIMVEPGVDAAGPPPLGIDGKTRRQGERPLLEAFRAQQLVTERFVAVVVGRPSVEEQFRRLQL